MNNLQNRVSAKAFKLPTDEDRTTFIGSTGSGKTVFALWTISQSKLPKKMPLVIVDYKRDDHIAKLEFPEIRIDKKPPDKPGVYILRPNAMDSENWRRNPLEGWLRHVWARGHTWLYFDEIYLVPGSQPADPSPALRAIYTTGRSRKIPVYSLMQRPVGVLRYPVSEASHRIMFSVTDKRDIGVMHAFVPEDDLSSVFGPDGGTYTPYHSLWRDVNRRKSFEIAPCPEIEMVLRNIKSAFKAEAGSRWI